MKKANPAKTMRALLNRTDQTVSVTDISRSAKKYFDNLKSGDQDCYVVMPNNAPAAVILAITKYEQIVKELEDLHVELISLERMSKLN